MGLAPRIISNSRFDCPESQKAAKIEAPNPNPAKYKIILSEYYRDFLVLMIEYEGCTNYEGKKILVFQGVTLETLLKQGTIDPHFSNNSTYHSPIARFLPTVMGLHYAISFCRSVHDLKNRA